MSTVLHQKAPHFKLFSSEKKEIDLNELLGKHVVLLFFPLAFTSTCTAELCGIRDNYSIYEGLNAVVMGISVDSLHTLGKYKAEQNINFELLSDFNKEVSTAYETIYSEFIFGMKGVSKRSAFVIDKQGVLRYKEVLEKAGDLPDFEAIQTCLKELNEPNPG